MGCGERYPKPPNSPKKFCACAIDVNASAANGTVAQNPKLPDRMPVSGPCFSMARQCKGSWPVAPWDRHQKARVRCRRSIPTPCLAIFLRKSCCAMSPLTRVAHCGLPTVATNATALEQFLPLSKPSAAHFDTGEGEFRFRLRNTAIDQHSANAGRAHFSEGDFLRAHARSADRGG
jgi:hypothetical protein